MKKLLMLSATWNEIPFILAAKTQGFYVITTGNNPKQIGHKYADRYVCFDYSDYDGMVKLATQLGIDAICQGCSDNCALTAAYMGEKLGLKGHDSLETARIIHRKDDFKRFVAESGIKSPLAHFFVNEDESLRLDTDRMFPLIVKPTDQAGGKGVTCVNNRSEYEMAVKQAFCRSNIGHIVVEPFIQGSLHSLSTFLVNQKVVAYASANDYSFKNRFLTNSGILPADNWKEAIGFLIPETERVAEKLHLCDGLLHMQYIMSEKEFWIVEMMRRSPGNNFTIASSRSTGIDWRDWIIRAEAGEDCHGIPETRVSDKYYGYHAVMPAKNGVFSGVQINPEFEKYIIEYSHLSKEGERINDYLYEKQGIVQFFLNNSNDKDYYLPQINKMVECKIQ